MAIRTDYRSPSCPPNPEPPPTHERPCAVHGVIEADESVPLLLYDVRAAARTWSCGERTAWRWIKAGLVRTVRLGRLVRISAAEVERVAREGISETRHVP